MNLIKICDFITTLKICDFITRLSTGKKIKCYYKFHNLNATNSFLIQKGDSQLEGMHHP